MQKWFSKSYVVFGHSKKKTLTTSSLKIMKVCSVYFPASRDSSRDAEIANVSPMAMFGSVDTFWEPKTRLTVSLFGTSDTILNERKDKITTAIEAIMDVCSIQFEFLGHNNSEATVRIGFNKTTGSWSYVGTDALSIPKEKMTMNLGWIDSIANDEDGTIKHEFCHTLGMLHEHQHPDNAIEWNFPYILYYYQRFHGWDAGKVYSQILIPEGAEGKNGTEYDPSSIMHYDFHSSIAGKEYHRNSELSTLDKTFLKAIYPFKGEPDYSVSVSISISANFGNPALLPVSSLMSRTSMSFPPMVRPSSASISSESALLEEEIETLREELEKANAKLASAEKLFSPRK